MKKLWTYFYILLGLSCVGTLSAAHAFYISILDIQYVASQQQLELKYKIFTDDLESGIRALENIPIALQDGIDEKEEQRIQAYLRNKTQLQVNHTSPELKLHSCSLEGDATFILFTSPCNKRPSHVSVQSKILVGLFPGQRNVVRYKDEKVQKMLSLSKGKERGELRIDE